jgi:hypothetical protein
MEVTSTPICLQLVTEIIPGGATGMTIPSIFTTLPFRDNIRASNSLFDLSTNTGRQYFCDR